MADKIQNIECSFPNENALYLSYMPFVQDGGLFILTKNAYELNDPVTLSVTLLTETEQHIIEGKVIWITPKGSQGNKPAGIGVQFTSDNKSQMCHRIETYLAGKLKLATPTHTM